VATIRPSDGDATRPSHVLIVSASMGAGHDGAARALSAELGDRGHEVEIKDFLSSGPLRIGSVLRRGYEFELKHVPSAYDATYRLWYRVPWLGPVVAWLVTALTRWRVGRWVRRSEADIVVSTYPLATLCLGRMRQKGRLRVPAVNFITDFGVHPLWVHRGIDLNLAIHDGPARLAADRTGRPSIACGPVVAPAFTPVNLPSRQAARRQFGIPDDASAVLVVAGSWGIGDLDATWDAIVADGRFTPVVVCGRDRRLLSEVSARAETSSPGAVILGWTDAMPALMAACDALVENAGGLTSLEAMRAGLPVVSFHPIAGHGKENTARMAEAGVSMLAADAAGLASVLGAVTRPGPLREGQIAAAHAMFRASAAELVLDRAARPLPMGARVRRRPAVSVAKIAAGLTAFCALAWAGLTSGVAMATEAGAGVAHPARGSGDVVYVGVRLNPAEVSDAAVVRALQALNVTAVVDDWTATSAPAATRSLVAHGVNVANGGLGEDIAKRGGDNDSAPWSRARSDARAGAELARIIHVPVTDTIPGRRLTAWDLVECSDAHTSLVVPNHILYADQIARRNDIHLRARRIYMINGLYATPAQLLACLAELRASLDAAGLTASSLAALA
jgi:processive 1,2-diacylglycerol beta-glucosyltransferase